MLSRRDNSEKASVDQPGGGGNFRSYLIELVSKNRVLAIKPTISERCC